MAKDFIGRGLAFPPGPGPQRNLALTNEHNELEQSIRIILSTAPGERVMRPTFGCRLHELVFAPNNDYTAEQARRYVEEALGMWEPRIRILDVSVSPHPTPSPHDRDTPHRLLITVDFEVRATHDRRSLVHPFYLIPGE